MNITRRPLLTLLTISSFSLPPSSFCRARGSLTPAAGPPAPVMKTLDQVAARTSVTADTCPGSAASVHVIDNPGSCYLTGKIGRVGDGERP